MAAAGAGDLERAYRYCRWITGRHYENFPVASWLLPRRMRPAVAAVYAFARAADDFADETKYQGRSLELLERWRKALQNCARPSTGSGRADPHPIFLALADTIRRYDLPVQWLDDLLTAFSMDVTKRRYENWEELMTYCRYSADPVGRLVLALFGFRDPQMQRLSDRICSGLQLANHWQDLRIDLARDILYIPQDLMRQHGVTENDLHEKMLAAGPVIGQRPRTGSASTPSLNKTGWKGSSRTRAPGASARCHPQPFDSLMEELVQRTRALFQEGEALPEMVSGGLRLELRLTLRGGRAILDRIEQAGYDVFRRRPTLSTFDKVKLLTHAAVSR